MRGSRGFEARPIALAALGGLWLAAAVGALADGSVGVGVGTEKRHRLSLTGDANANQVEIRYGTDAQGNDVLVIEGKNGTLVRGQATLEIPIPEGEITEIAFSGGLGDDSFTLDLEGLPENKRMREVRVAERDDSGGDGGNDTTTVRNVRLAPKGKLLVRPGSGDDTTIVEGCDADDLTVRDDYGDNAATIRNCNLGLLRVETKSGENTLRVEDSFYEQSKIQNRGAGVQDSLKTRIERTAGRKIDFRGARGDDEIVFEDSMLEQASFRMGDGADDVSFTNTFVGRLRADGGAGDMDCFDDLGDNDLPEAFEPKGFEPGACSALPTLEFFGIGSDPFSPMGPPADAVAWRARNPFGAHVDGPFALPGAQNPLGLPVLDPANLALPAHWGIGPECVLAMVQVHHVHDAFQGHGDPAPSACGHGALEWARFAPIF